MSQRFLLSAGMATAMLLTVANGLAQVPSRANAWSAPRTPDGHPDLQGVWTNTTLTPFERPAELAGKAFFTKEEAAAFAQKLVSQSNRDKRGATPEEDVAGAYNEAFLFRPRNHRCLKSTHICGNGARGRQGASSDPRRPRCGCQTHRNSAPSSRKAEDFTLPVRCIVWGTSGPPMVQGPYNNIIRSSRLAITLRSMSR